MPDHDYFAPRKGSLLPHGGTYRRTLPVSLDRLYENALDWEHLPHLHASSFGAARCLDAGAWGWRAAVAAATEDGGPGREMVLELVLDRACRRWITCTIEGFGAGTEIWTHAFPHGPERVDVVVDFFLPGVAPEHRPRIGAAHARHYARLYDEDVAMMTERQRQLDRRVARSGTDERTLALGSRGSLELPMDLVLAGREFMLVEVDGSLAAFPRQCPHQFGPLTADAMEGGVVVCPWHGDRFDVVSGDNLSGRGCRLSHQPEVTVDGGGNVWISATH